VPNVLLQKFPGPKFTATAKVTFSAQSDGEKTGLVIMGSDYAYIGIQKKDDKLTIVQVVGKNAARGAPESAAATASAAGPTVYLRVAVGEGARCRFSFSNDGSAFESIGEVFTASPGQWVGAKIGLFAVRSAPSRESGYADYDWFRLE
jgi:beta-xylosidase